MYCKRKDVTGKRHRSRERKQYKGKEDAEAASVAHAKRPGVCPFSCQIPRLEGEVAGDHVRGLGKCPWGSMPPKPFKSYSVKAKMGYLLFQIWQDQCVARRLC